MKRTYKTQIKVKDMLSFIENEMQQQGTNLNWRLDQWICDQVEKNYPEVDWIFEYTQAKEIDAEITIAVDFDIDRYRELQSSVELRKETTELIDKIQSIKGETEND